MRVVAAAILSTAALLCGAAYAADYPVHPVHRPVAVRAPESEPNPICTVGRYAYFRYAPPLATEYMVGSVYVTTPVRCDRSYH
jgi:hypothetical protein